MRFMKIHLQGNRINRDDKDISNVNIESLSVYVASPN